MRVATHRTVPALAFQAAKACFLFLATVVFLKSCVVEAFFIPSGSMVPTLKVRDYILVPKFAYGLHLPLLDEAVLQWRLPRRGDIVVFTRPDDPATEEDESLKSVVKRVIALPGETVRVAGMRVTVNETSIVEPYARWSHGGVGGANFGPAKVPDGQIFLLGDNRDESKDSRFWNYPFVDVKRVKGKAVLVYWSGDDSHRMGTILE